MSKRTSSSSPKTLATSPLTGWTFVSLESETGCTEEGFRGYSGRHTNLTWEAKANLLIDRGPYGWSHSRPCSAFWCDRRGWGRNGDRWKGDRWSCRYIIVFPLEVDRGYCIRSSRSFLFGHSSRLIRSKRALQIELIRYIGLVFSPNYADVYAIYDWLKK